MKKLMVALTIAGAMLVTSAANAAVVRVGIGPVRVGIRTAPISRAYVAPRSVIRPMTRPAVAPAVVRPARPAARAAVIHHRRDQFWNAVNN